MGMGYSACYADVISEENLIKLCPEDAGVFFGLFGDHGGTCGSLEEAARSLQYQDGDYADQVESAYKELQRVFLIKTGLELNIGVHEEDDGSRYDDLNGVYWAVDGVWEYTPAGKRFKDVIEKKTWVNFG